MLPKYEGAHCSFTFSAQVEHYAEGGEPFTDVDSVAGCADLCRLRADCVGFDFDRKDPPYKGSRCWIHSDPKLEVVEFEAVDHYTRGSIACNSGINNTITPSLLFACTGSLV